MTARADRIRELLALWARDGLDPVLELLPDDVVWAPLTADGRRFDNDGLRAFLEQERREGGARDYEPTMFEEIGDHVLVSGSLHVQARDSRVEVQPCLVYRFEGDRLRSVTGYPTRAAALAAIAVPPGDGSPG